MNGKRRPAGTEPHELEPGEFAKYGRPFEAWWVCTPNGLLGRLSMPEDVELGRATASHHVEEHEDGLITVTPQPGNSNSILVTGRDVDGEKSWHGYIEHGVWRAC